MFRKPLILKDFINFSNVRGRRLLRRFKGQGRSKGRLLWVDRLATFSKFQLFAANSPQDVACDNCEVLRRRPVAIGFEIRRYQYQLSSLMTGLLGIRRISVVQKLI